MVLIVTSICHLSTSLWYQHLICLMDQGSMVPCVNISMVPTPHMPCVTTPDSFPHMAWFISVSGIISMVPNVKTLRFPKPTFGAKCHTSLPHEVDVYCTMFHNPLCMLWFIWANCHNSYGAMCPGGIIGIKFHNFVAPHSLISLGSHVMFSTSQLVAPIIRSIAWIDGIRNPIE